MESDEKKPGQSGEQASSHFSVEINFNTEAFTGPDRHATLHELGKSIKELIQEHQAEIAAKLRRVSPNFQDSDLQLERLSKNNRGSTAI